MSPRILAALRDSLTLSGALMVSFGAWSIYPPAGWITGGVLLLAAGLAGAMRSE